MAETCFRCHGPDKSSRMAGMRLDLRDEALKPWRTASMPIVPGDPEKSAIIQRIFARPGARVMPPAVHPQRTDRRAEGDHPPMGGGRREVRGPLGLSAGAAAGRRPQAPARNPIDAFIQDAARPRRAAPFARSRSPHADPPRDARPHGPAAHTRRDRGIRQRHVAERLRKAGGPAAGLAAICRAAGHALAGRRALRRYLRLPRRQRLPRLALSRLRAARLSRQQAVRPVHARATGRRPDPQCHHASRAWPRPTTA